MKKMMIMVITLFITAMSAEAQTLQKFFDKYADDERFQYVSVNKGMINMGTMLGGVAKTDQKSFSKMNGIKILTLETVPGSTIMKSIVQELDRIIENGRFESAVEVRDKGERVNIYYRVIGVDNADMIIITKESTEFNCIWISGKMTKEEMMNSFSSNNLSGQPEALHLNDILLVF
jgi:HSP20 family molecular chaperone IbpA